MVRYFYAWTPFFIVAGTAVLLTIPYLALIAFMIVAVGVLAALTWAIVWAPLRLSRAIGRRWHVAPQSRATSVVRRTRSMPAGATVLLVSPPSKRHT